MCITTGTSVRRHSLSILKAESEEAVRSLKEEKPLGVLDVPSELIRNEGEATTAAMTALYQKICEQRKWFNE
ncbi:hypothetical protein DPMN_100476 [Dreissena polymorpha]|uniref:Uncharacterized protein n=1 Tax=Dreissena polymorpha TaxID=45954 RepID=A0A9D4LJB1_DREPO|nr:hypothetical protein DPMN_100476 [Dreissena polymorpha]